MSTYDEIDMALKTVGMSRRQLAIKAGIKEGTMSVLFCKRPEPFPAKYMEKIQKVLRGEQEMFRPGSDEMNRTIGGLFCEVIIDQLQAIKSDADGFTAEKISVLSDFVRLYMEFEQMLC